jgi:hypothetical protein
MAGQLIGCVLVQDYDEAIYSADNSVLKLSRTVIVAVVSAEEKRWVMVAPQGRTAPRLLLAKAVSASQMLALETGPVRVPSRACDTVVVTMFDWRR